MAKKSLWNPYTLWTELRKWHWKIWRNLEKTLGFEAADVIIDLAMLAFFSVLMSTLLSDIAAKNNLLKRENSKVL